jgi:hypothetical protein
MEVPAHSGTLRYIFKLYPQTQSIDFITEITFAGTAGTFYPVLANAEENQTGRFCIADQA